MRACERASSPRSLSVLLCLLCSSMCNYFCPFSPVSIAGTIGPSGSPTYDDLCAPLPSTARARSRRERESASAPARPRPRPCLFQCRCRRRLVGRLNERTWMARCAVPTVRCAVSDRVLFHLAGSAAIHPPPPLLSPLHPVLFTDLKLNSLTC